MAAPEEINADMLAFWNGKGGDIWVARQEHPDITLAPDDGCGLRCRYLGRRPVPTQKSKWSALGNPIHSPS